MFEKTVAVRRDFADGWFNLGNAYLNAGNYQKALESYRRALRISPEFPSAMKNMGYAFEKTGDLDEALVCYNKALAINKTDAMIYVNIASINCRLKKYDKARDFYLKAMQLSPREPAGWMGLRQLSLLKGDIPTYVKSTLAILRRLDDSAVAESLKCLRELKYDTGVEAVIKMADKLDLHTDGVEAERMLFLLRKKSSDVKSRMIYVRLCAVVKPANSIALCLSEYEYLTGKYDAAFARLKKVDAADPSKYRLMWLSAAACGKPAEAEKIAREYLNLHEDCFDAWFMLARICAETGRKQEAKESLVKAIENGFTGTDEISASFELEAIYNSLNM
jgi:tetratricopeptide (TPR) repeat protein